MGSEARGQRERLCVRKGKLLSTVRASEISETRDIQTGRGLGWPRFGSLTLSLLVSWGKKKHGTLNACWRLN